MVNWNQLVEERNAWVAYNFPKEDGNPIESVWGVAEEYGELVHHHLKERQSIRGTPAEHQARAKDAIGDLTVYLLGVLRYTGMRPQPFELIDTADHALLRLGHSIGLLCLWGLSSDIFDPQGPLNRIVSSCYSYCNDRIWSYEDIVWETWNGVKKRDWQRYPDTGLPEHGHLTCDTCGASGGELVAKSPNGTEVFHCVNGHTFYIGK